MKDILAQWKDIYRDIEKKSGGEYAVKIMNKKIIKSQDFDLAIKERNYMCLTLHAINHIKITNEKSNKAS